MKRQVTHFLFSFGFLAASSVLSGCMSAGNEGDDFKNYFRSLSPGSQSIIDPNDPIEPGEPAPSGTPSPGPSSTPSNTPTPPTPPEICNVVADCSLGATSRFDVKHCPVSGQMRYEFHLQVPAQPAHQIIGYRGLPNTWSPNSRMWTSLVPGAPNPQKRFVLTTEVDRSDANQRFVGEVTGEYPCAGAQDLPGDLAADRKRFANGLCSINVSAVSCRDSGIFTHTPGDMSLLPVD